MPELQPFQEKTVLVLGAGASSPYGFPLGEELKTHLLGNRNPAVFNTLKGLGHDDDRIQEFQDALRFGVHPTIDIFLERKTQFREIGAYFIAGAISQLEQHGALFPQKDWYAGLFELLDFATLQRDFPNVSVVTLNYDRSLEHFLSRNIDYNCRDEIVVRCHERRQRLEIVHAHGSIGAYPEVEYGDASRTQQSLRRAAEGIKIISDRLDESPDFRAAQNLIAGAKHVIFLGFGYNDRTLLALLSGSDREQMRFYGTAMQLDDKAKRDVMEFFHGNIILGEAKQDCFNFLRETLLNAKL
jgi:hypothetical protein